MQFKFLRIHRYTTDTNLVVKSPIEISSIDEQTSVHLNSWVEYHYPGFGISDILTEDQKKMLELDLTV